MDRTLLSAQALAHPYTLAFVMAGSAWLHMFRHEPAEALAQAEQVIALSQQHGFRFLMARGITIEGWALAQQGHIEAGIARMHEGVDALEAVEAHNNQQAFLPFLAEAYGQAGRPEHGLRLLDEAMNAVESTDALYSMAELQRVKGELLRVRGADEQAIEHYFLQALVVARQQEAKSLELRVALSLSKLWRQQGRSQEALALLAEIYGWFTEGFSTPDLVEAKALLEELS